MTDSLHGPSWYETTAPAPAERDRLVYDIDVDVCVIGGGLAGLTTARELARHGWSVAVLEANRVAWSASGRNAGIVAPGFCERLERIIERVGPDRARELWVLSAGGVDYVRMAIRETQMAGVSPVDGFLSVQRFDSDERLLAQADLIGNKFGTEVEAWSTDQVREVLKTEAYHQGLHFPGAFHINPLNYALGLAADAEAAGVKIFEQTRALEIDAAGVRKRVTTPGCHVVRAGHVVLAGSAHLAPLLPIVSGSILPLAGYMATTAPLGERLSAAMTYAGAVCDTRRAGDYHRSVDGDRLLWGGRLGAQLGSPRRLAKVMRRDIARVFPQLADVEIAHAWGGVMGYAVHKMPQIGEVSPGLWVATAFGGHGLNTSAMAGELVARAIAHGDDRWRLFASYDLVHAGGRIGQAAVKILSWSMRIHDALDEQLATQRAIARRRREVFAARATEEARQRVAEQAARLAVDEAERRAAAEKEQLAALQTLERVAQEAEQAAAQAAARAVAAEGERAGAVEGRPGDEAVRAPVLEAARVPDAVVQGEPPAEPAAEAVAPRPSPQSVANGRRRKRFGARVDAGNGAGEAAASTDRPRGKSPRGGNAVPKEEMLQEARPED